MKRRKLQIIVIAMIIPALLCGCSSSGGGGNDNGKGRSSVSYTAYIREGEDFDFEFDPDSELSYEELKDAEFRDSLSVDNWDKYFSVRELYLEHMEYDRDGNETETYMKGDVICLALKDDYYYVDNLSRNGTEFSVYVKGTESRVMKNEGITYDPVVTYLDEVRDYYGGDIMLILSNFVNSWDELTVETYTGSLESYEVVSAKGDLFLIDASLIQFKRFRDDILYFAAYGGEDEYFVIFEKTDDGAIDPLKEYEGAVYYSSGYSEPRRFTGFDRIVVSEILRECLKQVNR